MLTLVTGGRSNQDDVGQPTLTSQEDAMGKSSKEASQNQVAIKWAVRVFVLGVLVIVLILAVLDYQQKVNAQKTADAWLDKQQELIAGDELRQSALAGMVVGKPTVRDGELGDLEDPRNSRLVQIYDWKGYFRTYSIRVGLLPIGSQPIEESKVETIEGPGGLAD
jgi:hypothetical protein